MRSSADSDFQRGSRAVLAGARLEDWVEAALASKGFEVVSYSIWDDDPGAYGDELLLKNVPFRTIYGHDGRSEFVLKSKKYGLNIRIECKWQKSSGSVDEKFPYLLINCFEQMPEPTVFIIVDGGGAKEGAVEWLRNASKSNRYRTVKAMETQVEVMDFAGFMDWVGRAFRMIP